MRPSMQCVHRLSKRNESSKSSESPAAAAAVEQLPQSNYVPRRAILYVPGHDEKKISKVDSLDADCIVFDCEDGVAVNKKVNNLMAQ